ITTDILELLLEEKKQRKFIEAWFTDFFRVCKIGTPRRDAERPSIEPGDFLVGHGHRWRYANKLANPCTLATLAPSMAKPDAPSEQSFHSLMATASPRKTLVLKLSKSRSISYRVQFSCPYMLADGKSLVTGVI
ncbi:hypothetical protein Tco_0608678, partial [Tanacetum coccineum]